MISIVKHQKEKIAKIKLLLRCKMLISLTLELTKPVRLLVVLTGQDRRVEEDEDDNEPVEGL